MRVIAWIMLVLGILGTLVCGYSFWFSAGVAATPLTPPQLVRAQDKANDWLALTGLCVAASIIAVLVLVQERRKVARD